ncbi:hypothetical protein KQH90_08930 [Anaerosalibacter bizertensis]|uniref:hypothetical protein n=1 Tax=Anaerosalibacter bizertensis TaxID=932217 RepID=UPI001C0F0C23|nr:hypothetical protein [Anaerosalibacter bizertensis]MBU5294157.1 hypothetical protein [Anaerosalibacter bizertensis]
MEERKINNFLLNIFNVINEEKERNYVSEITILTIKSLMPSREEIGTRIDYERFKKEIELWYLYRSGENSSILNSIDLSNKDVYLNSIDDSLYIRIAPIVFSNKNWDIIKKEVLKNILYTTGNIEAILEGLLISKILFLIAYNDENIISKLKDEIISFSQVGFLEKYSGFFRVSVEEYSKKFIVDFERNRIEIINLLNGISSNKFKVLKESLMVIEKNILKDDFHIFSKGLYWMKNNMYLDEKESLKFHKDLCHYIWSLNRGRIDPDILTIEKYYLPDIFSFNEGDEFHHSLLNKCKVLKKENMLEGIKVYLATKSGIYIFKK